MRLLPLLFAGVAWAAAAVGADEPPPPIDPETQARLLASIVTIQVHAVEHARSNAELGRERAGSGVAVDHRGHVLTSVFLVQEPEWIVLTTADGRTSSATVAVQDHRTGIAILRAAAPLGVTPMRLGDSATLRVDDPVLVVSAATTKDVHLAQVFSRDEFAARWEYLVDEAIVTVPAAAAWRGAALIDATGRLVGIGTLWVGNIGGVVAGNLFVPVDHYKHALAQIARTEQMVPRAWLGLFTEPAAKGVTIVDMSPGGPAARAGLRIGDRILAVDGSAVTRQSELYRKVWAKRPGTNARLTVMRNAKAIEVRVRLMNGNDYLIERAAVLPAIPYRTVGLDAG